MRSLRVATSVAFFSITAALIVSSRLLSPSDLYDKDQIKTIGYTADITENGRWLLPRDPLGRPATKPPLYNWIGAAAHWAGRPPDDFSFKLPSLLAGAVVVAVILVVACGRSAGAAVTLADRSGDRRARALETGWLAASIWLASPPVLKYVYLARPDMLMTAFLTAAWACGTRAMSGPAPSAKAAAGFWVCVAGAALSKGPTALLPIAYVLVAAKPVFGGWHRLRRLGWWWGGPLALGLIGAWLIPAAVHYGEHVYEVMIHGEMVQRLNGGAPETRAVYPWWQMPVWFLATFAPWSALALIAIATTPRPWRGPIGPAAVWVILGIGFFACSAGKRADYLLPVLPQASLLAAFWLAATLSANPSAVRRVAVVPAVFAAGLCLNQLYNAREAQAPHAQNMTSFSRACAAVVGRDRVVFLVDGYHPFFPLIGRAGREADEEQLRLAEWAVCPHRPDWSAAVESLPVPNADAGRTGPIALYRVTGDTDQARHLRAMLRRVIAHNSPGRSAAKRPPRR